MHTAHSYQPKKIGHRLNELASMVSAEYDAVWDCCCDHGLLGMALLQRQIAAQLHFVDSNAALTQALHERLMQYFPTRTSPLSWQVHCIDLAQAKLSQGHRHLLIVAGVGGDLLSELLIQLVANNGNVSFDLLVCPVQHNYRVRQTLNALGFGLVEEKLVEENARFYELILASPQSTKKISLVGDQMWDFNLDSHRHCLLKHLQHFKFKASNFPEIFQPVLLAYQQLYDDNFP